MPSVNDIIRNLLHSVDIVCFYTVIVHDIGPSIILRSYSKSVIKNHDVSYSKYCQVCIVHYSQVTYLCRHSGMKYLQHFFLPLQKYYNIIQHIFQILLKNGLIPATNTAILSKHIQKVLCSLVECWFRVFWDVTSQIFPSKAVRQLQVHPGLRLSSFLR